MLFYQENPDPPCTRENYRTWLEKMRQELYSTNGQKWLTRGESMKFLENEARYHAYEIAASILQSSLDDKAVDGICQLNHFAEYTTGEVKKTIGRIIKALEAEAQKYDKKRKI